MLLLVAGLGLLPLLGVARTWRELVNRSGLSYLCGLVLAGIVSANLALVHVSFGWLALALFAAVLGAAGAWRLRGTERPVWRRPGAIALTGTATLVAALVEYARAFAVAPLNRYDAWAIWALKGHALYAFGWADPAVFAGSGYQIREPRLSALASVGRGDRLPRDGLVRHAGAAPSVPAVPRRGARGARGAPTRPCACSPALVRATRHRAGTGGVRPAPDRVCGRSAGARLRDRHDGRRALAGHRRALGSRRRDALFRRVPC